MPHALLTGIRSPLGWQAALAFARRGWSISGAVQRPASQALLDSTVRGEGLPIAFVRLDLSDPASIRRAAELASEQGGSRVDALVHLAEVGSIAGVEDQPDRELRRALDVNFVGPMRLVRELLPGMRRRGRGGIVGLKRPDGAFAAHRSAFTGSKAAWEAACHSLRFELRDSGVSVQLIEAPQILRPLDAALRPHEDGRAVQTALPDDHVSPSVSTAVEAILRAAESTARGNAPCRRSEGAVE